MLNKDLVEKVGPFSRQNSDRENLFWYKLRYRSFRLTRFRLAKKYRNVVKIGHDDANFSYAQHGSTRCSTHQILFEVS